jgi:hypothetical protein
METASFHKNIGLTTNISPVLIPGGLVQAWNVLIRRHGWIEQRRGYTQYNRTVSIPGTDTITGMFQFNTNLYAVTKNNLLYKSTGNGNYAAVESVGRYGIVYNSANSDPSRTYARSANLNGNCYLATNTGIFSVGSTTRPRVAGISLAPYAYATGVIPATGGFMPNNTGVAYRIVWGIQDDSNNVIQGPPSGRIVYYNTSGSAQNVTLTILMPQSVLQDQNISSRTYNYYIYRTSITAAGVGLNSIPDPGDQMNLLYQSQVSTVPGSQQITFTDITADGFTKGPDLYTNGNQAGLANSNYPPPACEDIWQFKGTMFYAKTQQISIIQTTAIGLPANWTISTTATVTGTDVLATLTNAPDLTLENIRTSAFLNGDFISVTGNSNVFNNGDWPIKSFTATTVTYTAGAGSGTGTGGTVMIANIRPGPPAIAAFAAPIYASYTANSFVVGGGSPAAFLVQTTGTLAQNIAATTQNIARVINLQNAGVVSYANVVAIPGDSATDPPGRLTLQSAYAAFTSAPGGSGTAYPNSGVSINLTTNTTYGTNSWYPTIAPTRTSPSALSIGRLYYSKTYQPEAVPLNSYFDIGDISLPIRRIMSTRDSLFIFKDDGLFRLNGDPNFGAVPHRFDDNIVLLGNNMVALLNNRIYAATTRGVCEISDYGVRWVSQPIQDKLRLIMDWTSQGESAIFSQHCVANERDGCVFFYMQFASTIVDKSTKVFALCYHAETNVWSQIDATGPNQYPGFYARQGNSSGISASSIYRHYWSTTTGTGQDILVENTVGVADDPALNTISLGVPLPGDSYYMQVTAASGGTVTLVSKNSWGQTAAINDVLYQQITGVNYAWRVTALAPVTIIPIGAAPANMSTVGGPAGDGFCLLFKAFTCLIEWAGFDAEEVSALKHWSGINILMDNNTTADNITVGTFTELVPTITNQTVTTKQLATLVFVPQLMQRSRKLSVQFTHSQAGKFFILDGISYYFSKLAVGKETA